VGTAGDDTGEKLNVRYATLINVISIDFNRSNTLLTCQKQRPKNKNESRQPLLRIMRCRGAILHLLTISIISEVKILSNGHVEGLYTYHVVNLEYEKRQVVTTLCKTDP
jgi:hypothetical protein